VGEPEIRQAAKVADDHRRATRGVVYAWAGIAGSYARFAEIVDAAGTSNFGGDRLSELHRAVGRFDDPAASTRSRTTTASSRACSAG
jgi:hypothetical protein